MAASPAVRFLRQLAMTVVFPLAWWQSLRIAGRFEDEDPGGRGKVLVGIVAGVALAGAGAFGLWVFWEASQDDMHDQLRARMAPALGDDVYQAELDSMEGSFNTIVVAERRLYEETGQEELHQEHVAIVESFLEDGGRLRQMRTTTDVDAFAAEARADIDRLEQIGAEMNETAAQTNETLALAFGWAHANETQALRESLENALAQAEEHELYRDIIADVQARDDAAVRSKLDQSAAVTEDMQEAAERAFAVKDDAVSDMRWTYLWILGPSLIGLLYAPVVWAVGSVLRAGYDPSETVGFKPYPSKSMGWFLVLGGFGWPALLFSAWSLWDMEERSLEGQIAL